MTGQDPRKVAGIFKLVMEIDSFTGGDLEPSDWNELVDYVTNHHQYKTVSLIESTSAAKTLAEYLHPKRKQVEKIDATLGSNVASNPLSEEEIELFKEKFNDEF